MEAKSWNQDRAAAEFRLTQQGISKFLSRKTGASLQLAWDIARARGVSLDSLLATESERLLTPRALGTLVMWRVNEVAARAMYGHVPPRAFEAVAKWCGEPPPALTAAVIGSLAEAWWKGEQTAGAGPGSGNAGAEASEETSGTRRKHTG